MQQVPQELRGSSKQTCLFCYNNIKEFKMKIVILDASTLTINNDIDFSIFEK